MPATATLTREQAQYFDLLETSLPVLHRSLRDASVLMYKEDNQFFSFYLALKQIRERMEKGT